MTVTLAFFAALALAFVGRPSGPDRAPALRTPHRVRSRPTDSDLLDLSRLVATGLAGGLNLAGALETAARFAHPGLAEEVSALLRAARTSGLALALARADGRLAPLATHLARAQSTGAAPGSAIESYADRLEADVRTRVLERVRTLPVRLVVPLTLFLLPGFLLVVVAPGVLDALADLGGGLLE